MSGRRGHPGVFKLLGAPDFGKTICIRPGRIAVAGNRRMHVEQRPVGIEYEGTDRH
jgi:hypothetical protein